MMKITGNVLCDIFSIEQRTLSRWTQEGLPYTEQHLCDNEGRLRIHRIYCTSETFEFISRRKRWESLAAKYNQKYGSTHSAEFHQAYCRGVSVGYGYAIHNWRDGGNELERCATLFEIYLESMIRELNANNLDKAKADKFTNDENNHHWS